MRRVRAATAPLAALVWFVLTMPAGAAEAPTEILRLFERYIDAWNRGDLVSIGGEMYRPPVYVFEASETRPLSTPQDVVDLLSPLRAGLDESGFSHSTIRDVSVCELGGGLALASLHYERFDRDGNTMDESVLASAYIVRRYHDGWHLVAHLMQDQPRKFTCPD